MLFHQIQVLILNFQNSRLKSPNSFVESVVVSQLANSIVARIMNVTFVSFIIVLLIVEMSP